MMNILLTSGIEGQIDITADGIPALRHLQVVAPNLRIMIRFPKQEGCVYLKDINLNPRALLGDHPASVDARPPLPPSTAFDGLSDLARREALR